MSTKFFLSLLLVFIPSHLRGAPCPSLFAQPIPNIPILMVEKANAHDLRMVDELYGNARTLQSQYLVFHQYGRTIGAAHVVYPTPHVIRVLSLRIMGEHQGKIPDSELIREIIAQRPESTVEVVTRQRENFRRLGFKQSYEEPAVLVYRKSLVERLWLLLGF